MKAVFLKEINSFFSNVIGYLVIGVFLVVSGLFLWVFDGEYNILDYGFANLSAFFKIAPWILIFLIPAITMKSFSDEKKQGTLETLLTKPLTAWNLVIGKYLGNLSLVLLALIPTLLYVLTIHQLGKSIGNFDTGEVIGSYIGLFLLSAVFTAIGIFSSSLTKNQIVSFISAMLLCFLFFFAFEGLSDLDLFGSDIYALEYIGISFHYDSISRGVLDTRDLIYFLSFIVLFLSLTKFNLNSFSK